MSASARAAWGSRAAATWFLLIALLVAWRVAGWEGPITRAYLRNAALLYLWWSLWAALLLAVCTGLSRSFSGRATRRRALLHGAAIWFGMALPELGLRAHRLGAVGGWGRGRTVAELAVSAALAALLVILLLSRPWPRRFGPRILGAGATVALAVFLLSWVASSGRNRSRDANQPNVLLVVVDALRADALGCYGNPLAPSPQLDALASAGWRFDHAFSTATTSVPGHTSILWGLDVPTHGALSNEFDVPQGLPPSLAESLRERGYRTVGICQNPLVSGSAGFGRGFDHYWSWFEPDMAHAPWTEVAWQFAPTRWYYELRDVEPILARAKSQLRLSTPWFLFVQLLSNHDPYDDHDGWATAERIARIESRMESGAIANTTTYPQRDVAEFIARYYGALAYADRRIGELVAAIPEARRDDTIVVITADHGENLAEHGDQAIGRHFGSYQTSLSVPLIATRLGHPDRREVGELTGVDRIGELILDLASGSPDDSTLARARKSEHIAYSRPLLMSLDDSTKVVVDGADLAAPPRVFRWREDPWDRRPIAPAPDESTRTRIEELYRLQALIAPLLSTPTADLRPEKLQRLRALGYID